MSDLTLIVNAMMHRSTVPSTWLISAGALVLAPAVCLIAFPRVVTAMLPVSDLREHIVLARQLGETGAMLPHFGYHALVIVVQALTPADWVAAAGIVTLGGAAVVLTLFLRHWPGGRPDLSRAMTSFAIVTALLLSPYLLFVQMHGGLGAYLRTGLEFSRNEAARNARVLPT